MIDVKYIIDFILNLFKKETVVKNDELETTVESKDVNEVTTNAPIMSLRIESLKGQNGNAKMKIWSAPAKLHFIARLDSIPSSQFVEYYDAVCTIKRDGVIITDGFEFIHGDEGCKNPCYKRQLVGQGEPQFVFTAEFTDVGYYTAYVNDKEVHFKIN